MKDHRTCLEAAAMLAATRPQVRFFLLGTGIEPSNRALAKAVSGRRIGDRIRLLGESDDMAEVYAAPDILTLSSACGEGFLNALDKTMASGLPCVTTDIGDASELVGQAGIVVPPRDPQPLADAWWALIEIGAEGRRSPCDEAPVPIARDYGLGAAVARYESLYDDIAVRNAALRTGRSSASASSEKRRAILRR